jgi:hypothetical protein
MLEKLLAAGAYTMANQIDFRRPADGRSVNLGFFDAAGNVTIASGMQGLVDELLNPPVEHQLEPAEAKPIKPRKPRKDAPVVSDEDFLGSLSDALPAD